MNTKSKLDLIISYQNKLIQAADKLERGIIVDSTYIMGLVYAIQSVRDTL